MLSNSLATQGVYHDLKLVSHRDSPSRHHRKRNRPRHGVLPRHAWSPRPDDRPKHGLFHLRWRPPLPLVRTSFRTKRSPIFPLFQNSRHKRIPSRRKNQKRLDPPGTERDRPNARPRFMAHVDQRLRRQSPRHHGRATPVNSHKNTRHNKRVPVTCLMMSHRDTCRPFLSYSPLAKPPATCMPPASPPLSSNAPT